MTYMSMNIRIYPTTHVPDDLELLSTKSEKVLDLDHLARKSGPYHSCVWAMARDIPVYDVDNCWMFFAMRRDQLVEFNQDRLGGAADLSCLANYPEDTLYVLESEEF